MCVISKFKEIKKENNHRKNTDNETKRKDLNIFVDKSPSHLLHSNNNVLDHQSLSQRCTFALIGCENEPIRPKDKRKHIVGLKQRF